MKPIPIGNDLNVSWAINRMGEGVPLSAYKLDLYMECGYAKMPVTEYTVDGNTVKFPFWGKDQKKTGVYSLKLTGNAGKEGMFTVDACGAFRLVSGCEVSCQSDLQVPAEVSCQSDLQVPANGLSAYQVWLSNGHQGTEGDFLTWLQQPAQSATEEAGKATEAANTAASKADTAATKATEAAETATQATEELKGAAGEATDAANEANTAADAANKATLLAIEAAKQADAATDAAEEAAANADKAVEAANTATKSATDAAQAADTIAQTVAQNNTQWTEAEQARETAEEKRQEDTQQAVTDANTARDAANTAAEKAETAATEATEAAGKANEAAQGIDAKIATKQDTLESGVNIKTINGMTVLGAGNMVLMPCIQHYKWVSNAATTRKQVPAALRARDVKISYNNASGTYIVEQYQSDNISDAAWGDDANWKGCRTPLTPMFEAAGAVFNDETGYYEMNGLTDIDEAEIQTTYKRTFGWTIQLLTNRFQMHITDCRTNFPLVTSYNGSTSFTISNTLKISGGNSAKGFRTLRLSDQYGQNFGYISGSIKMNSLCNGIERIIGNILINDGSTANLGSLSFPDLVEVNIRFVLVPKKDQSFSLQLCPLLSRESLNYTVENFTGSEEFTFTLIVHPDVYAKLTDEANAEWYAVNTAAQAKQIAFATTEKAQVAMLAMRTLPEAQILDGELLAPAGCYLTQAEETPIENRLFLTRKILLSSEDVSRWRVATMEEKQEQDEYFASQLPEPMTEG